MTLKDFTDKEIEQRLKVIEQWIAAEKDYKNLPALNHMFQKLLDELARRDVEGNNK